MLARLLSIFQRSIGKVLLCFDERTEVLSDAPVEAREHLGALVEAKQNVSDAALKYRKQASMHALDLAYFCISFKLRSLLL